VQKNKEKKTDRKGTGEHVKPVLRGHLWLTVKEPIDYKICYPVLKFCPTALECTQQLQREYNTLYFFNSILPTFMPENEPFLS